MSITSTNVFTATPSRDISKNQLRRVTHGIFEIGHDIAFAAATEALKQDPQTAIHPKLIFGLCASDAAFRKMRDGSTSIQDAIDKANRKGQNFVADCLRVIDMPGEPGEIKIQFGNGKTAVVNVASKQQAPHQIKLRLDDGEELKGFLCGGKLYPEYEQLPHETIEDFKQAVKAPKKIEDRSRTLHKQYKTTPLRDGIKQYKNAHQIFPKITLSPESKVYTVREFIEDAACFLFEEKDERRAVRLISDFFKKKKIDMSAPAPYPWVTVMQNYETDETVKLFLDCTAEAMFPRDSASKKFEWAKEKMDKFPSVVAGINAYEEKWRKLMETIESVLTNFENSLQSSNTAKLNSTGTHRSFWMGFFEFFEPDTSGIDLTNLEDFYAEYSQLRLDDELTCHWADVAKKLYEDNDECLKAFVSVADEALHHDWSDLKKADWVTVTMFLIVQKLEAMKKSSPIKVDDRKPTSSASNPSSSLASSQSSPPRDLHKVDFSFSTLASNSEPFKFGAGSSAAPPQDSQRRPTKPKSNHLEETLPTPTGNLSLQGPFIFGGCGSTAFTGLTQAKNEQHATTLQSGLEKSTTAAQTPATPLGLLTLVNAAEYHPALSLAEEQKLVALYVVPLAETPISKKSKSTQKKKQQVDDTPKYQVLQAPSDMLFLEEDLPESSGQMDLKEGVEQTSLLPFDDLEALVSIEHGVSPVTVHDSGPEISDHGSEKSISSSNEPPTPKYSPKEELLLESLEMTRLMMEEDEEYDDVHEKQVFCPPTPPPAKMPTAWEPLTPPYEEATVPTRETDEKVAGIITKVVLQPPVLDLQPETESLSTDNEDDDDLDKSLVLDYFASSSLLSDSGDAEHDSPFSEVNKDAPLDAESEDNSKMDFTYEPDSLPKLPSLENLEEVFADLLGVEPVPPRIPELDLHLPSLESEFEAALFSLNTVALEDEDHEKIFIGDEEQGLASNSLRGSFAKEDEGTGSVSAYDFSESLDPPLFKDRDELLHAILDTDTVQSCRHSAWKPSVHIPKSDRDINNITDADSSEYLHSADSRKTANNLISDEQLFTEPASDGPTLDQVSRFFGGNEPLVDNANGGDLADFDDDGLDACTQNIANGNHVNHPFQYDNHYSDVEVDALSDDFANFSLATTTSSKANLFANEPPIREATHRAMPRSIFTTDTDAFDDLLCRALEGVSAPD